MGTTTSTIAEISYRQQGGGLRALPSRAAVLGGGHAALHCLPPAALRACCAVHCGLYGVVYGGAIPHAVGCGGGDGGGAVGGGVGGRAGGGGCHLHRKKGGFQMR
jgi:hypothetical protein